MGGWVWSRLLLGGLGGLVPVWGLVGGSGGANRCMRGVPGLTFSLSPPSEKVKRFLQEFFRDGELGKKVFPYQDQLVRKPPFLPPPHNTPHLPQSSRLPHPPSQQGVLQVAVGLPQLSSAQHPFCPPPPGVSGSPGAGGPVR